MTVTNNTEALPKLPVVELMLVVGLPLVSIMAGIGLAIVSYLHGFADLATH
jgi:hypothetical protein